MIRLQVILIDTSEGTNDTLLNVTSVLPDLWTASGLLEKFGELTSDIADERAQKAKELQEK